MISHSDIEELAEEYKFALGDELQTRYLEEQYQRDLQEAEDLALYHANEAGGIRGKNAEARKWEAAIVLTHDDNVQEIHQRLAVATACRMRAEVRRKHLEQLIGLTKAWLYSQAQIG